MARTKQTARQSTGGRAPRQVLSSGWSDGDTSQSTLVELYNATQTRTIAVTGTDEFDVEVDIVSISFKIMEEDLDYQKAIVSCLSSLDFVRSKIKGLGISNDAISSDALRVNKRHVSMRNGEIVPTPDSDDDDGPSSSGFGFSGSSQPQSSKRRKTEEKEKEKSETTNVVVYQPCIILRVQLTGEAKTVPLFPRIMFTLLQMGIPNHESPIYDSSLITEHRHRARENAILNAHDKANNILTSLDSDVCVGKPVTVNDIHVDPYDIHQSDGISSYEGFHSHSRNSIVGLKRSSVTNPEDQVQLFSDALLERVDELFVIPPIRIAGKIKVIFEIIPMTPEQLLEKEKEKEELESMPGGEDENSM